MTKESKGSSQVHHTLISFITQNQLTYIIPHDQHSRPILPPANFVHRYSLIFSCGDFAQIIDWHNQYDVTATVLVFDQDIGYDDSIPTTLTMSRPLSEWEFAHKKSLRQNCHLSVIQSCTMKSAKSKSSLKIVAVSVSRSYSKFWEAALDSWFTGDVHSFADSSLLQLFDLVRKALATIFLP